MAPKKQLNDEHKDSMARGRRETRIVELYLRHVEASGRSRSPEQIAGDLERVEGELVDATAIARLTLLQERENLQREAMELPPQEDGQIEEQFIAVAKNYADRKGVSYSTWREIGVPKEVLVAAGIPRTRRPNSAKLRRTDDSTTV